MVSRILQQVRQAVGNLNPQDVRDTAERPLAIRLVASASAGYAEMEDFLSTPDCSRQKRFEQAQALHRADDLGNPQEFDLEIYEKGLPCPEHGFSFSAESPGSFIEDVLTRKDELGLPLARYFTPFRRPVSEKVVAGIARENALFSLATSLPNVIPGIQLPWAAAEISSDTAFLTVNQIRMLFLLAGASDRPIGYREQRAEIASVIAGAFGWRSLARQLVSKVPLGGGVIPKAAIAYAGTHVVGSSMERLYRIGSGYTRAERRLAYEQAFEKGKDVARKLLRRSGKEGAATAG